MPNVSETRLSIDGKLSVEYSDGSSGVVDLTVPPSVAASNARNAEDKAAGLGLRPVGFNSYELIYNHVLTGSYTYSNVINYMVACKSNFVRVLYPAFSTAEWTTNVFGGTIPTGVITDASFSPTFLARSNAVIDAMEEADLRGLFCLFWSAPSMTAIFGESIVQGIQTTSKTYDFMVRFSTWFFKKYGERKVLASYSFFNELGYDTTGTTAPTPANLSAVFKGLLAIGKTYAGAAIATTDLAIMPLAAVANRATFDSEFESIYTVANGFDALGVHLYAYASSNAGMNYIGMHGAGSATFAPSATNTLGFEGLEGLMSAWRGVASSLGKPLWITECGVATDTEAASGSLRKNRMLSVMSRHADQILIWNAADITTPQANQVDWQIKPGSTLASVYQALLLQYNSGRAGITVPRGGAMSSQRAASKPEQCFKSARSAGATVRVTSTAVMQTGTQALMYWFRRDSTNNNFETYIYCRDAGNLFGFAALAGAVASTDPDYIDFRSASGSARNTSALMRRISDGEWHHFAYIFRTVNGQIAVELWLDGMFWDVVSANNAYAGIAPGTTLYFGGGTSNGAPVSMQDVTLAAYASPRDILDHMHGAVLPQSVLHLRADAGSVVDLSRSAVAVTVGSGVTVLPA